MSEGARGRSARSSHHETSTCCGALERAPGAWRPPLPKNSGAVDARPGGVGRGEPALSPQARAPRAGERKRFCS